MQTAIGPRCGCIPALARILNAGSGRLPRNAGTNHTWRVDARVMDASRPENRPRHVAKLPTVGRGDQPLPLLLGETVLRRNSFRRQDRQSRPGRRLLGFRLFWLSVAAIHSLGHRSLLCGRSTGRGQHVAAPGSHQQLASVRLTRADFMLRTGAKRCQSFGIQIKAIPHDAGGPKAATPARPRSGVNLEVIRGHLAAFAVGYQFEVHLLAFAQITQPGALHGTDVDECIRPTLIGCDEAEALLGIEPLDGPGRHAMPFQKT